jgi:hypothetical protein
LCEGLCCVIILWVVGWQAGGRRGVAAAEDEISAIISLEPMQCRQAQFMFMTALSASQPTHAPRANTSLFLHTTGILFAHSTCPTHQARHHAATRAPRGSGSYPLPRAPLLLTSTTTSGETTTRFPTKSVINAPLWTMEAVNLANNQPVSISSSSGSSTHKRTPWS